MGENVPIRQNESHARNVLTSALSHLLACIWPENMSPGSHVGSKKAESRNIKENTFIFIKLGLDSFSPKGKYPSPPFSGEDGQG
jgi:hypothetical protein